MSNPVDQREYENLIDSLSRGMMRPKDQLVKICALANGNTITCKQLVGIINVSKTIQIDIIVALYPSLSDKENINDVISALKWQEEKDECKQKLGL